MPRRPFMTIALISTPLLLALLWAPGCKPGADAPSLDPAPPVEQEPVTQLATQIEGRNYLIEQPSVQVVVGESGSLELHVRPTAGFKINLLFPWQLTLDAPVDDLSIATLSFDRDAAVTFTEDEVVFSIPMSCVEAGTFALAGELRFSVCNDNRCDTPIERVGWSIAAQ